MEDSPLGIDKLLTACSLSCPARTITGRGGHNKVPVVGILECGGKARTAVVPNRKKTAIQAEVRKHVEAGSALYSLKRSKSFISLRLF